MAHGDKYDYSETEYCGDKIRIKIICKQHGPFFQFPSNHIKGCGCQICAANKTRVRCAYDILWFLKEAKKIHGDFYDYSRSIYTNSLTKIEIQCPKHGLFRQTPNSHIYGKSGCKKCGREMSGDKRKSNTDTFIKKSISVHGDRYDYSNSIYKVTHEKIEIICKKHGAFYQTPSHHISGSGCPKCAGQQKTTMEFLKEALKVHGDRYDYSKTIYLDARTKIEIICKQHGSFWQTPPHHSRGTGCPKCAGNYFMSTSDFINKSTEIHGDKFNYDKTEYKKIQDKVLICCKSHGDFYQIAENHLNGSGCLKCWQESSWSKSEKEIADWIYGLGFLIKRNDRSILGGNLEIDIYIPEIKIGVEYNGSYWHSDKAMASGNETKMERKIARAAAAGIRLITVWDFDWLKRRPIVERHLLHALGINPAPRIGARECAAEEIGGSDANAFYADHHIQGACRGAVLNLGLKRGGELVAAMSFTRGVTRRGKTGDGEWELARYATSAIVRGGASKLFKAFIETARPKTVWSFSDNQHFGGGLYETLGFDKDGTLPADYRVIDPKTMKVWHKSQWQRKNIPNRLLEMGSAETFTPDGDPRTERQMQDLTGALRVWDAGKTRWIWKRP